MSLYDLLSFRKTTKPSPVKLGVENIHEKNKTGRSSKLKIPKECEESKDLSVEETPQVITESPVNNVPWQLPEDEDFLTYLADIREDIATIMSTDLQIRTLACFVCEKMGESINKSDLTSFSYELHISELKSELNSNIIPIGMIQHGTYYHRALLFKALADVISLPCSLVRGDYGRAWNEVQICEMSQNGQAILPPKNFVVDLMHQPGDLFLSGSPEAVAYQRI